MDTGDLSDKTYHAIIVEAERFNHALTLQFGLLSYECKDEKEFIEKSKNLVKELQETDETTIADMFFGDPPKKADFHKVLNKLLMNIIELQKEQ